MNNECSEIFFSARKYTEEKIDLSSSTVGMKNVCWYLGRPPWPRTRLLSRKKNCKGFPWHQLSRLRYLLPACLSCRWRSR